MKIKPTFVELRDPIPVYGPYSELDENLMWEDFLTLVAPRDHRVVVCLRNGVTHGSVSFAPSSLRVSLLARREGDD